MRSGELRELKRLYDALRQSGMGQYKVQLGYVFEYLQRAPRFRAILDLLKASTAGFETDEWIEKKVIGAKQTRHEWPASESQKLCVLLRIMELSATKSEVHPTNVGRLFVYSRDLDVETQAFTEHVVFPLVDYLQTRLATESEVLHHLERMRRQIEWFEQAALYDAYKADTKRGEDGYDRRVREFLFAEGIDYPFSQPVSSAGKADVIADLDGDDPLICEIKLYDGAAYGPAYIRQGVVQAVRYAHDYGKSNAHLVVFNLSDERLQLPSDEAPDVRPRRLQIEGVTVFIVVVQAKPLPSASKDRQREVRTVQREQLVPTVEDSNMP
jgi:hypothetical protein